MLQTYYTTGVIPAEYSRTNSSEVRPVVQDYLRLFILNIFFMVSSYVHVRMFIAVYHCLHFLVY